MLSKLLAKENFVSFDKKEGWLRVGHLGEESYLFVILPNGTFFEVSENISYNLDNYVIDFKKENKKLYKGLKKIGYFSK